MPQSGRPPLWLLIQKHRRQQLLPSLLTARAEENQITEFNPPARCACDPHLKAAAGETVFPVTSLGEEKVGRQELQPAAVGHG